MEILKPLKTDDFSAGFWAGACLVAFLDIIAGLLYAIFKVAG